MTTENVTVDVAGPGDVEHILHMNQRQYGGTDLLVNPADYTWRMDNNPAGRGVVPVLRDANRQVVGFICMIPLRIRIKGRDVKGATGTNLLILPAYRGGLTLTKLIRRFGQTCREQGIAVHFSFVSKAQYRQACRSRPETATTIPMLIKVPRPARALGGLLRHYLRPNRDSLAGRGSKALKFERPSSERADQDKVRVRVLETFDERFDAFWGSVCDKYPAMVCRDRAYLVWRFGPAAGREYRILAVESGDGISGYLVQRSSMSRGIHVGLIMDFLVSDGPSGEKAAAALLVEAERFFDHQGASVIAAISPTHSSEHVALRRARYRNMASPFEPRTFWFATVYHGPGQDPDDAIAAGEWLVTLADWEAH